MDRIRSFFRARFAKGFVLERSVWSWVMVIGAVSRATSYWYRPPSDPTPTSVRIENALSYPSWTIGLLFYATLIAVGTALRQNRTAWIGHLLGLGACGTLALSIFFAAILDGASWSAFWPLVVVGLVHFGRLNALGPKVAEITAQKREERHSG